jgi:hypothetical protein
MPTTAPTTMPTIAPADSPLLPLTAVLEVVLVPGLQAAQGFSTQQLVCGMTTKAPCLLQGTVIQGTCVGTKDGNAKVDSQGYCNHTRIDETGRDLHATTCNRMSTSADLARHQSTAQGGRQ